MYDHLTLTTTGFSISTGDNQSVLPVILGQEMCLLSLVESFCATGYATFENYSIAFIILAIGACEASLWFCIAFLEFNLEKTVDFESKNVIAS